MVSDMRRALALAAVAALAAAGLAPPLSAQTLCGPTAQLRAMMVQQFGERQVMVGIVTDDLVAELWLRPDGRSFSYVQTDAAGRSCIVGAGTDWMAVPAPTSEPPPGVPG